MKYYILTIVIVLTASCESSNSSKAEYEFLELQDSTKLDKTTSNPEEYYIFKGGHKLKKSEWLNKNTIEYATKAYGTEEDAINIMDCYMLKVAELNYYEDIKVLFNPSTSQDNIEEYQAVFDKYNLKTLLITCVNTYHSLSNNGSLKDTESYNPTGNGKKYLILHLKETCEQMEGWEEFKNMLKVESFFNCWAEQIILTQGSADLQLLEKSYFNGEQLEKDMSECFQTNMK